MGPIWPRMGPRWAQEGPRQAQEGPRWPQDGPKMAPRWAQDGPKIVLGRLSHIKPRKRSGRLKRSPGFWPPFGPSWGPYTGLYGLLTPSYRLIEGILRRKARKPKNERLQARRISLGVWNSCLEGTGFGTCFGALLGALYGLTYPSYAIL